MGRQEFFNQLVEMGYHPVETANNGLYFEYLVDIGVNQGKRVLMGFENLHDFPLNAPHGPHFRPIDEGWANPSGPRAGVHNSNFGQGWVHWSRPFQQWNRTKKTVKEYLAHIKNLLLNI